MAAAQTAIAYPSSLEREPLLAWLQRETDIEPNRVVAVTPQALISIVSTFPAGPGSEPRVVLRAEALNADTVTRSGAVSWHVSMSADCKGRRVRLGETTGYPGRNLLGDRAPLRPPETEWRKPDAGAALDAALRAVCEPSFKGPFEAVALKVARQDAPATASAEASMVPPTSAVAAPAKPSAVAPKPGRRMVAQIGASPSEADARALIAALGSSLGGRETWVETAQVNGKTWRRAVVGGFADSAEAARFCAGLKAAGRGCFVRVG